MGSTEEPRRSRFRDDDPPTSPSSFIDRRASLGRRATDQESPPERESWHLHKATTLTIIGFIFTLVCIIFSAFLENKNEMSGIHSNEAVVREQIKVLHERDDKAFNEQRESMNLLRDQYKDISARLDRLIDRKSK